MFQINQNNLHLLLPGKISWLVEYLHEDYGFTLQESLHRIYHSELYKKAPRTKGSEDRLFKKGGDQFPTLLL